MLQTISAIIILIVTLLSGTAVNAAGGGTWIKYANGTYNYSIDYLSNFTLTTSAPAEPIFTYPSIYTTGTNLQSATVSVVVNSLSKNNCLSSTFNTARLTSTTPQAGSVFYLDHSIEGAAGHRLETEGYYTYHNNRCYQISLQLYYVDRSIYEIGQNLYPPNAPKTFDRKAIETVFNKMFRSFSFVRPVIIIKK